MTTPAHSAKSSANRIDVFLSHASEDLSAAHMLTEAIEQAGWSVFLAARDLPSVIDEGDWSQRIDEALDASRMLVLLTSPEALDKRWVTYEWRSFHDDILSGRGGWIVPCCIRSTGPDQLGRALRRYQVIDLRDTAQWPVGLSTLLTFVETHLHRPIRQPASQPLRTCLAIEGTGVRAAMSAELLADLERATFERQPGGRFVDRFDVVVGSSFGALTAVLLAMGLDAQERMLQLRNVTRAAYVRRLLRMGIFSARYDLDRLRKALAEVLGRRTLSSVPQVAFSTFDAAAGGPRIWSHHACQAQGEPDWPLVPLVAASIATPYFFDPVEMQPPGGSTSLLFDGSMWSADPALVTLEALRQRFVPAPLMADTTLVALGCGRPPTPTMNAQTEPAIVTAVRMATIAWEANWQLSREQLRRRFFDAELADHFFSFDPTLPADERASELDNHEAFDTMRMLGKAWLEANSISVTAAALRLNAQGRMPRSSAPGHLP